MTHILYGAHNNKEHTLMCAYSIWCAPTRVYNKYTPLCSLSQTTSPHLNLNLNLNPPPPRVTQGQIHAVPP